MTNPRPNLGTALIVCALIGAFLFVQADDAKQADHHPEWTQADELLAVQQEEAARASREFAGQAVCGPGAAAQWDGDELTCSPKRGKAYHVAGVRNE